MLAVISNQLNIMSSSPTHKDTSNPPDPTTLVPYNRRSLPLEGGHSTQTGGMWTLKHEIRSLKLYKLLIKTELKRDASLDLNILYDHIKMCLNAVTRLLEEILPGNQSIKRHSEFAEYFIPDRDHPSFSLNF